MVFEIHKYLNDIIKDVETERISETDPGEFKQRLEKFFLDIGDERIFEYERNTYLRLFKSRWQKSERNPLRFRFVDIMSDGEVYFCCDTSPAYHAGGFKYFSDKCEFAFLENGGLYLSIGIPKKDKIRTYYENIYLASSLVNKLEGKFCNVSEEINEHNKMCIEYVNME